MLQLLREEKWGTSQLDVDKLEEFSHKGDSGLEGVTEKRLKE